MTTGGAPSNGKWKVEFANTSQNSDFNEKVWKALNDLKSEMGFIRKLVQGSDTSKPADTLNSRKEWRASKQDGKSDQKKARAANFAARGIASEALVS